MSVLVASVTLERAPARRDVVAARVRESTITRGLTFAWTQGRGHDLACSMGAGGLNNGHATWRDVAASEGQIRFMRQLGLEVTPQMTKGQAFDRIAIAKFRKQWRKAVARARHMVGAA